MKFNYNIFYNYYLNKKNMTQDQNLPSSIISHYDGTNPIPIVTKFPDYYITIDGKRLYVRTDPNYKKVYFIEPKLDSSGKYWDNHYHFLEPQHGKPYGILVKDKTTKVIVRFHKTNQDIQNINTKRQKYCWIEVGLDISDCIKDLERCGDITCWHIENPNIDLKEAFPDKYPSQMNEA